VLTKFPINRHCWLRVLAHAKFIFRAIRANHARASFYGDSRAITHPAGRPHLVDRYRHLVLGTICILKAGYYFARGCERLNHLGSSCDAHYPRIKNIRDCIPKQLQADATRKSIGCSTQNPFGDTFNPSKSESCCYLSVIKDFAPPRAFSIQRSIGTIITKSRERNAGIWQDFLSYERNLFTGRRASFTCQDPPLIARLPSISGMNKTRA